MFNARTIAAIAIAASSMLTGCASIVNGSNQVISVDARSKGQQIVGATCRLDNGKGTFFVTTPGTVTVHRAYDDMNVKCEKEGLPTGLATVKSSTKPMAYGNILFGGVIGAAVDAGSGAAYDYPSLITVLMEEVSNLVSPPAQSPTAPAPAPGNAVQPVAQK
jgi:hypothetical protein